MEAAYRETGLGSGMAYKVLADSQHGVCLLGTSWRHIRGESVEHRTFLGEMEERITWHESSRSTLNLNRFFSVKFGGKELKTQGGCRLGRGL